MKRYTVKEDYLTAWGEDTTTDTIITGDEVFRLAYEWDVPVADLLEQLVWIDGESCISPDNGATMMNADEAIADMRNGCDFSSDWNLIVDRMDDSIREAVHAELGECTEAEFLARYLELSPDDLILG